MDLLAGVVSDRRDLSGACPPTSYPPNASPSNPGPSALELTYASARADSTGSSMMPSRAEAAAVSPPPTKAEAVAMVMATPGSKAQAVTAMVVSAVMHEGS